MMTLNRPLVKENEDDIDDDIDICIIDENQA